MTRTSRNPASRGSIRTGAQLFAHGFGAVVGFIGVLQGVSAGQLAGDRNNDQNHATTDGQISEGSMENKNA